VWINFIPHHVQNVSDGGGFPEMNCGEYSCVTTEAADEAAADAYREGYFHAFSHCNGPRKASAAWNVGKSVCRVYGSEQLLYNACMNGVSDGIEAAKLSDEQKCTD
jgi:hypothetical protein